MKYWAQAVVMRPFLLVFNMYSKNHFPNQKPDEFIIMFLRRHWIVVLKIFAIAFVLAILPIIIYLSVLSYMNMTEIFKGLFVLGTSAFYLFVILYSFTNFIDYYLDVWIVTNKRVVNIEQHGLFSRTVSEKELNRMQDISANMTGFWQTLLHYGNVQIQTAGEDQHFMFKQIPFPDEVSRLVSNLVSEYKSGNKMDEQVKDNL